MAFCDTMTPTEKSTEASIPSRSAPHAAVRSPQASSAPVSPSTEKSAAGRASISLEVSPVKAADDALWAEASAAVFGSESAAVVPRGARRQLQPGVASARAQPVQLLAHELSVATGGFNPKHCVGAGGFGHVFRAELPKLASHTGLCAIKRLPIGSSEEAASKEIEMISKCCHPNVLPLLGYCLRPTTCFVYPMMRAPPPSAPPASLSPQRPSLFAERSSTL